MISLIDESVTQSISNIFGEFGIPVSFTYNTDLDVLLEFRRSIRLRVENSEYYTEMLKSMADNKSEARAIGVYNRSPVRRSRIATNNLRLKTMKLPTPNGVQSRKYFLGEIEYSFVVLLDNYRTSDLFELIYVSDLSESEKIVHLEWTTQDGADVLDSVKLKFSSIGNIYKPNSSDLRAISFNVTALTTVFLPYYTEDPVFTGFRLVVYGMDENNPINSNNRDDQDIFYESESKEV